MMLRLSVLLVEETGIPRENHSPVEPHIKLYQGILPQTGIKLTFLFLLCKALKYNYQNKVSQKVIQHVPHMDRDTI
jgi:hypothetical protein